MIRPNVNTPPDNCALTGQAAGRVGTAVGPDFWGADMALGEQWALAWDRESVLCSQKRMWHQLLTGGCQPSLSEACFVLF